MAEKNTVQGVQNINTASSDYNALSFIIQQAIRQQVYTAIIVKVTAVYENYIDCIPMVTQIDGQGEAVPPTELFHLPYFRYHAGEWAIKLDPVVGDMGFAVFAQKDCSSVKVGTDTPQKPASFRESSMANGFYYGGFLNKEPSYYMELKQDGSLTINAPAGININGNVTVSGDVVASGISLVNHVHGGVESGGSTTSTPQ